MPPSVLRRSLMSSVVFIAVALSWSVASSQQACAPGRFASSQTGACEECAPGRYQPAIGQEACFECEPGRFADASGRTRCDACAPGRFQSAGGRTSCEACPPGSARDATGQTSCSLCTPGRFSPAAAATACDACEPGRYSDVFGAMECTSCAPGRYATGGEATCRSCEPGRYARAGGMAACRSCEPGRYSDAAEARACTNCPPGKFSGVTIAPTGEPLYATTCTAPNTYNCYRTKDLKQPAFTAQPTIITDPYVSGANAKVKGPSMLCAPVDLGSGIEAPSASQCCYNVRSAALAKPHPKVQTSGGRYTGSKLKVLKSQMICEPCGADPAP